MSVISAAAAGAQPEFAPGLAAKAAANKAARGGGKSLLTKASTPAPVTVSGSGNGRTLRGRNVYRPPADSDPGVSTRAARGGITPRSVAQAGQNVASSAVDAGQSVAGALPGGSGITKIVSAMVAGLLVLEIAAQATGQSFNLRLGAGSGPAHPAPKMPYTPLYPGQTVGVTPAVPWTDPGLHPVGAAIASRIGAGARTIPTSANHPAF